MTWGTEGDIRPFHALARVLADHGHDVALSYWALSDVELADDDRLTIRSMGRAHIDEIDIDAIRREVDSRRGPIRKLRTITGHILWPLLGEVHDESVRLAATSDLIVRHPIMYPTAFAARAARIPSALLQPAPLSFVGQAPANGLFGTIRNLEAGCGLLTALALDATLGLWQFRQATGVRPRFRGQRLVTDSDLTLVAASPALCDARHSRGGPIHVVGQLETPREPATPSAEVAAFLDAGDPPVLLTVGSIVAIEGVIAEGGWLLEGLERAGVRALLQIPESMAEGVQGQSEFLRVDHLDYASVVPRCSAVIHHGGAGTTHAVVRAATPAVVIPHFLDQYYWADRVQELGVGTKVDFRRADPVELATAIRRCAADDAMSARAGQLAHQMTSDRGGERAVALLEELNASR
ncbi:MAG: glycosyltransferase [Acidimicrobiales bacterium]